MLGALCVVALARAGSAVLQRPQQRPALALARTRNSSSARGLSLGSAAVASVSASADVSLAGSSDAVLKDVVYHLHIPKVAGISFGLDALDMLAAQGLKQASREGCYAWQEQQPRVRGTAVMLRNPRKHVLSQYDFCADGFVLEYRQAVKPAGSPDLPPNFEDWVQAWSDLQDAGWHGDFTPPLDVVSANPVEARGRFERIKAWSSPPFSPESRFLDVKDWHELDGGGTIWHFVNVPFQCYSPLSFQTQRLSCTKPMEFPQKPDLDRAVQNMKGAWFVGLVDAYQASICLFHAKLSNQLPAYCDCRKPELWNSFKGHQENTNEHHRKISEYPPQVLELVDKLTVADRALYEAGRKRFVDEIREVERAHGTQILCNETKLALVG